MNKYTKKIVFILLFSLIILFMSFANVNAETITETVGNDGYSTIGNNATIIGITKFENGEIITAYKAAEATYNDIDFNMQNYGYYEMPKIYNFLKGKWYEIDENNEATTVTDEDLIEDLNSQDIYYVNNEEKLIDVEYNPEIEDGHKLSFFTGDASKDELIKYENGVLKVPATVSLVGVEVVEIATGDRFYLESIEREDVTDTEYRPTTARVKTLEELKAALADKVVDTIELQADITGINETLKVENYVYFMGFGHKLQFNELPDNSSGLEILANGTTFDELNIEMTPKDGLQGIYGIKVYNADEVEFYNITVSNADTGILVDGSDLTVSNITLNDNEFGGIGAIKSPALPNVSTIYFYSALNINNETNICPAVWSERYQGEIYNNSSEFTFTYNEDIPNAYGKTQEYFYLDETLSTTIEVSSEQEFKTALTIENVKEIILAKSFEVSETIVVDHKVTVTGNGNKLTGAEGVNIFQLSGIDTVLTINDTIIETKGAGAAVRIGEAEQGIDYTLKAVIGAETVITAPWYGVMVYGENSTVDLYGTINITSDGYGITGNGLERYYGKTIINIKEGSKITATEGFAIYAPQDGTVNIEGGELTGASIVGIKSGTLNVIGGTLKATGDLIPLPSETNDGKIPTGDVIAVEVNDSYFGGRNDKNIKVNVTGGTLTSENAYIIREVNTDSSDIEIEVTGLYDVKVSSAANVNVYGTEKLEALNVNELKSALLNPYITEITLTENIEELPETLVADHSVTINGNGKTITGAENKNIFQVSGTNTVLTINNTKIVTKGSGAAVRIGDAYLETGKTLKAVIGADTEITANQFAISVFGEGSTVDVYGKIKVAAANGFAIAGNGLDKYFGYTSINIKEGAEITVENGIAIYTPQVGTVNIEGGKITAATVVGIKSGVLNITGGTLEAIGDFVQLPEPTNDGKTPTGDVIAVEVNDSYYGGRNDENIVVNVTGGTLTSKKGYIIREVNTDSSDIGIVVTGTYSNKVEIAPNVNVYSDTTPEISNVNQLKSVLVNPNVTEVTLTENIEELSETLVADHSVTINGNGKTITGVEDKNIFQVSGTDTVLTINNAKIVTKGSGAAVRIGDAYLGTDKTLKAVIGADTEITAANFAVTVFGEGSTVDVYGKITVEGTDGYAIAGNGLDKFAGKTSINVKNGAEITVENGIAIYAPQDGTINIEGGKLTAATVVGIKSGVLNITGGTLEAIGGFVELPAPTNNGKTPTGDVIAVEVNDSYYGGKNDKNIVVNVTGGTLTSKEGYIIREVNTDSSDIGIVVTGDYSTKQELATNVKVYVSNI